MIANLLLDCSTDIMKKVEESQRRDEERDQRRRAADEARQFQEEQREHRRNIKMDEVNKVVADEFDLLLRVEGDKLLNEVRS